MIKTFMTPFHFSVYVQSTGISNTADKKDYIFYKIYVCWVAHMQNDKRLGEGQQYRNLMTCPFYEYIYNYIYNKVHTTNLKWFI